MPIKPNIAWIHRQPVAVQLKLANLLTIGGVIFLAGILLLAIQVYLAGVTLLEQTRTEAHMTSENLTAAMVFNDRQSGMEILASLSAFTEISNATVYDAQDQVFGMYSRHAARNGAIRPISRSDSYQFSADRLEVVQPFKYQGRYLGSIYMVADLGTVYRRLAWYVVLVTLVMLMSLALAHLVLIRLQRVVTGPLRALAQTSELISTQGDFSIRAKVNVSADIGLLATAFNTMLDRIEKRESELKGEIIERERAEAKLDRLAHFDSVTGLHNRHFFNERLSSAVARAQVLNERAVVMFIDLDNFKSINDTLGHDTGDELLRIVSRRLESKLRAEDTISRIGGDEFSIILENVSDPAVAPLVAQQCLASLAEVILINGHEIYITASMGITACPDDAVDMHALLKYSDMAMYCAKNSGKNAYKVFTSDMRGEVQDRFAMHGNLRRALERDQFVLHYQPQIELLSGRISGVEALLRWIHPDLGTINPLEFIPIAEESGLIIPIGNWILRSACGQLKIWHDMGLTHLRMAINLSGRQLKEETFAENIFCIIRETGVVPHALELELTESMLMDATDATIEKLGALRSAGIRLAIDDFGTGYSSMSYLKLFPISTLKIDKSFVRDLPANTQDAAIVKAIISMARSLNLHVVAEGIETAGQEELLMASGCDSGQGFFYSKAVPAQQIVRLVAEQDSLMQKGRDLLPPQEHRPPASRETVWD
ncbi:putative bifunctional diguanylate cyclase/phosphodiesterase [Janthinobacterium sp.]|uniref:putative bifunctional diguanylate cyclase/phosphodiesterase n=1 Tax=Janthinobacterium sp. TaxID=1871054 RepID=UPI00293D64D2|nr:EAL domain-containing protein [Janthinobacterium sp.]